MARIRTIKPEFFTSEQLAECSTNARLLFVGTWVFSDDKGRHPLAPRRLKMEVFPGDPFTDDDIFGMFRELWKSGLVRVYANSNGLFFDVTGWHHQKIDKPQAARYPAAEDCRILDYSSTGSRTFGELSSMIRDVGIRYDPRDTRECMDRENEPDTHTPKASGMTFPQCFDAEAQDLLFKFQAMRLEVHHQKYSQMAFDQRAMEAVREGWGNDLASWKKALGHSIQKQSKDIYLPDGRFAVNGVKPKTKPKLVSDPVVNPKHLAEQERLDREAAARGETKQ